MVSRPLSVSYEFRVIFTDHVEFDEDLVSREAAREILDYMLYEAVKHSAITLSIKGEEDV